MSANNTLNSGKTKTSIIQSQILDNISNKATSLRPNRSITPSRSLYRTGIKTVITNIKSESPRKEEN